MLEYERFQIVRRPKVGPTGIHYEIRDAVTERLIGTARIKPNRLAALLGRLAEGRLWPLKLEAFETDDEPLVFIVRRNAGLLRGQARIADADDHRVGRLLMRGPTAEGGFWIVDRHNLLFLTGEFLAERSTYILRSRDGCVQATLRILKAEILVAFDASLYEQPLAKMLVLGAAFALDMLFPEFAERGSS
jgi:hypothetical protein